MLRPSERGGVFPPPAQAAPSRVTQPSPQQQYLNYFNQYRQSAGAHWYPFPANPQEETVPEESGGYYGGGYYGGGGGGGGGGGTPAPAPVTWSEFSSGVQGAPNWWKAMKPSDTTDENIQYIAALNMLIPFLSPEDQKNVASTIYNLDAKNFTHLNPEKITADSPALNQATINQYTGAARAVNALSALTSLAGAVNKKDEELGPGYRYLRSILDTVKNYGGTPGSGQTRGMYQKMLSALDPLYAQSASGSLAPYGSIAKMLAQPFFSKGQLVPLMKAANGQYVFGNPNKELL